jgi:hypothetical protein
VCRFVIGLIVGSIAALPLCAQTALVVQEGLNRVTLFSAANPSDRAVVEIGSKPHEIELTPDGQTAFVTNFGLLEVNHKEGSASTTISVLDVEKRTERARWSLPAGSTAPHGLKLRPPCYRELFTNAEEGNEHMVVLDARCGVADHSRCPPACIICVQCGWLRGVCFHKWGASLPDRCGFRGGYRARGDRVPAWTADRRSLIVSGKDEVLILDPKSLAIVRLHDMDIYHGCGIEGHWFGALDSWTNSAMSLIARAAARKDQRP